MHVLKPACFAFHVPRPSFLWHFNVITTPSAEVSLVELATRLIVVVQACQLVVVCKPAAGCVRGASKEAGSAVA
jgi:hypothetical protein